jgi:hypothetical protein
MLKRGREANRKKSLKLREEKVTEVNKETKAVCLCCNPELEVTEETLLVHLTKILDKKNFPKRLERYLEDVLDELQEATGSGIAAESRNARILIEDAIRSGFKAKDQIKNRTGLEWDVLNGALAVMLEYKRILPKVQGGKPDAARGQRKVFFEMNDEVKYEDLPEEFSCYDEPGTEAVTMMELVEVH